MPIQSPTIGRGRADLLISLEPLESLRYLDLLSWSGLLISNTEPVRNIPDYPDPATVLDRIRALPHAILVDANRIAREAGSAKAANIVLVGAASMRLPIDEERIRELIRKTFAAKGDAMVRANLGAFARGQEAVQCQPV